MCAFHQIGFGTTYRIRMNAVLTGEASQRSHNSMADAQK